MEIHEIAHGGCTDTVRESALEVNSGRKIPCRTWDSNPCQYCQRLFMSKLFSLTLYQLNYPRLLSYSSFLFIYLFNNHNNHNRELTERFRNLKALYNLKKKHTMHKYPQLYKSIVYKRTKHKKINKHLYTKHGKNTFKVFSHK